MLAGWPPAWKRASRDNSGMRKMPRKFKPIMMITMPAAIASSCCQTRSRPPMVEAPAPSATKTVEKPSTKAIAALSSGRRAAPPCSAVSARKSSTDTPAI